MKKIVKKYNLSSRHYIRDRLRLLNVGPKVLNLFWEPPEGVPGKLTVSHLRIISGLPSLKWQRAVALMVLRRNWNSRDVEAEVRRIKGGKVLRDLKSYLAPLEAPPPVRSKKRKERLEPEKIQVEKPLADEEVFQEYPEGFLREDPPVEVGKAAARVLERFKIAQGSTQKIIPNPTVKAMPVPESGRGAEREIKKRLPIIVNRDLLEPFFEKVLIHGVKEGLDLGEEKEDGSLIEKLKDKLDFETYRLLDKGELNALPLIALRAFQIWSVFMGGETR